jgi:hypothetical protein
MEKIPQGLIVKDKKSVETDYQGYNIKISYKKESANR